MLEKTQLQENAAQIIKILKKRYPIAASQLAHENPWQLLVATILSAQCTDERVNQITPELFRRWPTPEALAKASAPELEEVIHSAGFFRNKAKNLLACANIVHNEYEDKLPPQMEELIKLPGVARKTANIVLYGGFGINAGIAVDTHVKRISYRLGLTDSEDPVKIEQDLIAIFPQREWGNVNYRLVWFGRDVCKARKPGCEKCEMRHLCPQRIKAAQPDKSARKNAVK